MNKRYLISTNTDGHLYCGYTTEKLLDLTEALETIKNIWQVDPNAKLVSVTEQIDPERVERMLER